MSIIEIKCKTNVLALAYTQIPAFFSISVPLKADAIKINTSYKILWTDWSAEENYKGIQDSVPLCLKLTLNTHYVFMIAAIYSECVRDATHTHKWKNQCDEQMKPMPSFDVWKHVHIFLHLFYFYARYERLMISSTEKLLSAQFSHSFVNRSGVSLRFRLRSSALTAWLLSLSFTHQLFNSFTRRTRHLSATDAKFASLR